MGGVRDVTESISVTDYRSRIKETVGRTFPFIYIILVTSHRGALLPLPHPIRKTTERDRGLNHIIFVYIKVPRKFPLASQNQNFFRTFIVPSQNCNSFGMFRNIIILHYTFIWNPGTTGQHNTYIFRWKLYNKAINFLSWLAFSFMSIGTFLTD